MRAWMLAALAAATLATSACSSLGNVTSVYRKPDLADGRSVVLDAEQWAILNIPQRVPGIDEPINFITCAMPSPDSMSVVGAGSRVEIDNPTHTEGAIDVNITETGAYIGLRTQSIQLMRDAMYRMCEAYAAGGMDPLEYGVMMRRFQTNMVAVLAIEQLTGPLAASMTHDLAAKPEDNQGGDGDGDGGDGARNAAAPQPNIADRDAPSRTEATAAYVSTIATQVAAIAGTAMSSDYAAQMCFELMRLEPERTHAQSLRTSTTQGETTGEQTQHQSLSMPQFQWSGGRLTGGDNTQRTATPRQWLLSQYCPAILTTHALTLRSTEVRQ